MLILDTKTKSMVPTQFFLLAAMAMVVLPNISTALPRPSQGYICKLLSESTEYPKLEREELMEFGFFTLTEFFKCNEALFTLSLVMIKEWVWQENNENNIMQH